ncbi:MAG: sulfotransferase [Candidatus Moranbacteria bacterium]|nr:sulfotransferase [Candidatus Moranbacteria bacterium]
MKKEIKPIFIMGAPRSGTTFLASSISSRDDIITLPEMHYMHELLREELIFGKLNKDYIKEYLMNHVMFYDLQIHNNINKIISRDVKYTIFNIINEYNTKNKNKKFKYWVEHTPHNYKHFNLLVHTFPDAKFIHIVRDGRAVYNSTIKTNWGYKDILKGARDWKERVEDCLLLNKLYPQKVMTIKYEELVSDPKNELNNICNFLNIEYKEAMLSGKGLIKPSFAIKSSKVGKKADTKSIFLWKKELKQYEINYFNKNNQKLLEYFNYDVDYKNLKELKLIKKCFVFFIGFVKRLYYRKKFKKQTDKVFK